MERSTTMTGKGVYFDLVAFARNLEKLQTPNTPAVSLLYALREQLAHIEAETMEARWARHARMAQRTGEWVDAMASDRGIPLRVLAPVGFRSPTVTCVELPEGVRGPSVVASMRDRGWTIGGGYGKLKEETIRIGHMGDHTVEELDDLLGELTEVLS